MLDAPRATPLANTGLDTAAMPVLRTAGIAGLGAALPPTVISNAEVAARIGVEDGWIEKRTGIRNRRTLAPGERLSDLAAAAGRAALEDAGLAATDLDLILVATLAADEITPGAAPLVADALGSTAAAIDVNAACTGFLTALDLAGAKIEAGRADHALVIGAEALRRFVDLDDRRTAGVFGDGAGAAVVSVNTGALGPVVVRSDGSLRDLIVCTREEQLIRMDGHATFLSAVTALSETTVEACAASELGLDEIDLFVFHQANRRILDAVAERLGLDRERVVDVIADIGNTSAATLPIALTATRDAGRLHSGARVVLGAMGAGFVYGAGVLTWA